MVICKSLLTLLEKLPFVGHIFEVFFGLFKGKGFKNAAKTTILLGVGVAIVVGLGLILLTFI